MLPSVHTNQLTSFYVDYSLGGDVVYIGAPSFNYINSSSGKDVAPPYAYIDTPPF